MTRKLTTPVAGEIISTSGHRNAVVGGSFADVLDMTTWTVVEDTMPLQSLDERAQANAEAEAFSEHVRRNPPKRVV